MTFTSEQMNKARAAKSAEELLAMAKASGIEMTADEAAKHFAELHKEGELSDDELDAVAGGDKGDPDPHDTWYGTGGFSNEVSDYKCPVCGAEMTWTDIFKGTEKTYNIYTCGESGVSFEQHKIYNGDKTWWWARHYSN